MEEKELFNYGDKELNVSSLLKYIDSNQQSYLDFYSNSISDANAFIEKVNYIKEGIKNGNITTNGEGVYADTAGRILENDELMSNALHYIDIIAKELSKKQRALTQSEIAQREKTKRADVEKSSKSDVVLQETKLNFDPENPFIFERSLKSQFGPTLTIPYTTLKKTITRGADGKEDYSIVKQQFKNAFNSMRTDLNKYNNSENYISQVNNLESALFDGVWDHKDELAIHQAGLNNDFESLKDLFTYKLPEYNPRQNYKQQIDQVLNPGDYTVIDGDKKSILYLDEQGKQITEDITDDEYYKLSGTSVPVTPTDNIEDQSLEELAQALEDDQLGWEVLGPLALDIYSIASPEPYSATGAGLTSDIIGLWQDLRNGGKTHWGQHAFNILSTAAGIVPYIGDAGNVTKVGAKLVNFSEDINKFLSTTSDFLSKLAKSPVGKTVGTTAGIAGTAWTYMDLTSDDSIILEKGKQALDAIKSGNITAENVIAVGNSLAVALQVRKGWKKFRSLDPNYVKTKSAKSKKSKTNTKEENTTAKPVEPNPRDKLTQHIKSKNPKIKESELSEIQDALDKFANQGIWATARSLIKGQNSDYLKAHKLLREKGKLTEAEIENVLNNIERHDKGGIIKAPKVADLTLKQFKFKKPLDLNPDGIINSLSGYIVNAAANAKKREVQKAIPIYQEIPTPEKGFKTAYTYDLEKAKNEIMAEANSIKPITSDASQYYAARNEAIANARNYTTKLDTEINERIHQTANDNQDITFENAVNRTNNANTNAKYRHDWEVEQKQGEVDYIEANNQSLQNLNKEIKHSLVTASRQKQKQRDAYAQKHLLKGIMTTPSNYFNNWNKYFDLIWYKGQNNQLETDEERTIFQQLYSVVQQAIQSIMAQYEGIEYEGMGELHIPQGLMEYTPKVATGAKGMKINKQRMYNFINKLK